MSGGAIIGAAAIGAVASNSAASKASSSANAAMASADAQAQLQFEMGMEQLDFQKQQYEDWEAIFGPIQENLSSYYQNLTPDSYAAQGLQGLQQSYQVSRQNLDKNLASRGISDSGVAAAAQTQLEASRMSIAAGIKQSANDQVTQQQSSFLGLGLGQQGALQAGVANSYSNLSNIYGQQSANNMSMSQTYSSQAAQANAGIGQSIGQGVSTYMTYNALQTPQVPNYSSGSVTQYPSIFNS